MERNFGGGMSRKGRRNPEKQIPEAGEDAAGSCRFRTHEHPELQKSSMA